MIKLECLKENGEVLEGNRRRKKKQTFACKNEGSKFRELAVKEQIETTRKWGMKEKKWKM